MSKIQFQSHFLFFCIAFSSSAMISCDVVFLGLAAPFVNHVSERNEAAPSENAFLSWEAPTENTDGTQINGTITYNIYHGMEVKLCSERMAAGPVLRNIGGDSTCIFDTLETGRHFFLVTSVNESGLESVCSNEVYKDIDNLVHSSPSAGALFTLLLAPLSISTVAHAQTQTDLSLHWDFSGGNATDLSGNGNDGVVIGASLTSGYIGDGLDFDGSNDYVFTQAAHNLSEFTYSAWIYPTAFGDKEIFSKAGSNRELRIEGSHLRGCIVASTNACSNSVETFTGNEWQFVAMRYTHSGTVKLFIDGVEVSYAVQSTASGTISSDSSTSLNIARRTSGTRYFQGKIDEVRVYSRALSDQEILDIYNEVPPPPPPLPPETCHYVKTNTYPGATWQTAVPEDKCMDSVKLQEAIDYASSDTSGSGIIIRDGFMVGQWGDILQDYPSASAAKSGTTAVAAILAIGDGLVSFDNVAGTPFPDVTLWELLSMTSGIDHQNCNVQTYPEGSWAYSNCGMNYAAQYIQSKIPGGDLENYLRSRVYDIIGAIPIWDQPIRGDVGLNWSVSDGARLGLLLLRNGEWNGQCLLRPREIALFGTDSNPGATMSFPLDYIHNGHNPSEFYGLGFWLANARVMDRVPGDLVTGMGAFGCSDEFFFCYSPSTDIVIARAGDSLRTPPCDALHYQGNEVFLKMVFDSILECN